MSSKICGNCKYWDRIGQFFRSGMSGYTTEQKRCLAPIPQYLLDALERADIWWINVMLDDIWVYPTEAADGCACYEDGGNE